MNIVSLKLKKKIWLIQEVRNIFSAKSMKDKIIYSNLYELLKSIKDITNITKLHIIILFNYCMTYNIQNKN